MKKIKCLIIFVLILSFTITSFAANSLIPSTTVDQNQTGSSNSFLSVSSNSVGLTSEFYLVLNLNKIDYNKFSVEITNDMLIAADKVEEKVVNVSTNNIATTFTVNKSDISLDKIAIVFTSPNSTGKVNFKVKLTNLEVDEKTLNNEITIVNNNINTVTESIKKLQDSLSGISNTVTNSNSNLVSNTVDNTVGNSNNIVSNTVNNTTTNIESVNMQITELQNKLEELTEEKNTKQELLNNLSKEEEISVTVTQVSDKGFGETDSIMDKEMTSMKDKMTEMQSKMTGLEGDLSNANKTISSLTNTVSYQGSGNNYLSTLSIKNVEFKNEFNKTNQTYFANVDSSITSVSVTAVAEDSTSIVTVYGNTSLKSGKNKILVNVTSEDGSVRTYKIYISK